MMLFYSLALTLGLILASPWWIFRMLTTQRYREGLRERLGGVPARLRAAVKGKRVIWVHAVSVGEVLAATRLVAELGAALGDGWQVVISTTTKTGQALARERFGAERVFYFPLDFAFAVRAYMRALKPVAVVLMESELWPRVLHECQRSGVPVVVVNARVSERSFARAMRVRTLWGCMLRKPTLWLAQSEEDARRLVAIGAKESSVRIGGNLKYDIRAPKSKPLAEKIRDAVAGRAIIVAGSTHEGEEEIVLGAFYDIWAAVPNCLLVIAPRHPERFAEVLELGEDFGPITATTLMQGDLEAILRQTITMGGRQREFESNSLVVILDTIGDLASLYSIAHVAFVGGSLVERGGHNPLEPAQFGVPVVIGPSYGNFRDIVAKMKAAEGITVLCDGERGVPVLEAKRAISSDEPSQLRDELRKSIVQILTHPTQASSLGQHGREVFEAQQGATARAVEAIVKLIPGAAA